MKFKVILEQKTADIIFTAETKREILHLSTITPDASKAIVYFEKLDGGNSLRMCIDTNGNSIGTLSEDHR